MDGRVAAVESLKIKSIPFHRARIKHNIRWEGMLLSTLLVVIMICPLRFTYAENPPVYKRSNLWLSIRTLNGDFRSYLQQNMQMKTISAMMQAVLRITLYPYQSLSPAMSAIEPVPEREPGLETPIPPLILVRVREEPDDHEIDEAVYSEPTPNQEVVSCGNIETPSTDPVTRKMGRPFKNKGPMKKEKGKLFKKRIISGAASSPPIPATSSAPSTDSERMQLSTFSESLSIIRRNPRSLRTKKQLTVALGVSGANHGKATGLQSEKRVQGGSAEKPLENRADEVQASATGLEQLADAAMVEKLNGTLNNAFLAVLIYQQMSMDLVKQLMFPYLHNTMISTGRYQLVMGGTGLENSAVLFTKLVML